MRTNPVTSRPRASFAWSDDFLVGVPVIDEQHRRLVDLIAGFYAALAEKRPAKRALGELLAGLVDYTRYHFETEERLMADSQFPPSSAHREQHAQFVQKVADLVDRFTRGQLVLSIEATSFLRDWLTNHILVSDKQLGRHLSLRGMN